MFEQANEGYTNERKSDETVVTDITERIKNLRIISKYPGDDIEKRDIDTTGAELLEQNHICLLSNGDAGHIAVLSRYGFETSEKLAKYIRDFETYPAIWTKKLGHL